MRALFFAILAVWLLALPRTAHAQSSCGSAYEAGQEARASGDLKRAREEFKICAQAECPDFVVQDCTKWLVEVGDAIPKITIKVLDESGVDIIAPQVTLNGEPFNAVGAVEVNPGQHEIVVEVEGRVSMTKRLNLSAGERHRVITIRPEKLAEEKEEEVLAEPQTTPPPAGFYIASTTAIVGFGSFAALAISGTQRESSLRDGCAQTPEGCDVSGLKTQYLLADVSLGVGVVSAGIATFLFLTKDKNKPLENPTAWDVQVGPTPGGAAASFQTSF